MICVNLSPDLVAVGMLQLLLEDKSKVGSSVMLWPKNRLHLYGCTKEGKTVIVIQIYDFNFICTYMS